MTNDLLTLDPCESSCIIKASDGAIDRPWAMFMDAHTSV